MKLNRRSFFKTIFLTISATLTVTWKTFGRKEDKGIRYGMVIDLRKCYGCHSCSIACKSEFNVPLGVWRSWVKVIDKGKYPNVKRSFLPRLCNHCKNPPCVSVCPTQASYRDEEQGLVDIREGRCIGCKMCIVACPYDARFTHPTKKVANKCDFCIHRVEKGVVPSCVNTCPSDARIFGDLNDPNSEVRKLVDANNVQVLKPELDTEPSVFYIDLDEDAVGGYITA
jgi:tetrathionate reductase subunit B